MIKNGITYRNDQRVSGTKGSVYVHAGDGIIKGENPFQYEGTPQKPTVIEYADMIESIRKGNAINEGRQIAESTMTAIMGRMSAYTGRALKWDWAMKASKSISTLTLLPYLTNIIRMGKCKLCARNMDDA